MSELSISTAIEATASMSYGPSRMRESRQTLLEYAKLLLIGGQIVSIETSGVNDTERERSRTAVAVASTRSIGKIPSGVGYKALWQQATMR